MLENKVWISPDQRIKKTITKGGETGLKPIENCECSIIITNCNINVDKYNNSPKIIGQSDNTFERLLDIVLSMMSVKETADVIFLMQEDSNLNFTLQLVDFTSYGFIFEWDAKKKLELAKQHKLRGVDLFRENRHIDASHRFSKASKLLCSIPVDIENKPTKIDGVEVMEIEKLKSTLFNNLSSCHLRNHNYEDVIVLCKRVLQADENNLKAMYKLAVAYDGIHEFDKAFDILKRLLVLDPENKAVSDKLNAVHIKLRETNAKVNAIIKKMFM